MNSSFKYYSGLYTKSYYSTFKAKNIGSAIPGLSHGETYIDPMIVNGKNSPEFDYTPSVNSIDQVYVIDEYEFTYSPSTNSVDQVYTTNELESTYIPVGTESTSITLINLTGV